MFGFLVIVIVMMLLISVANKTEKIKKEPCKGHKWEYKEQPEGNYLQCSKCGKIPNVDIKD